MQHYTKPVKSTYIYSQQKRIKVMEKMKNRAQNDINIIYLPRKSGGFV